MKSQSRTSIQNNHTAQTGHSRMMDQSVNTHQRQWSRTRTIPLPALSLSEVIPNEDKTLPPSEQMASRRASQLNPGKLKTTSATDVSLTLPSPERSLARENYRARESSLTERILLEGTPLPPLKINKKKESPPKPEESTIRPKSVSPAPAYMKTTRRTPSDQSLRKSTALDESSLQDLAKKLQTSSDTTFSSDAGLLFTPRSQQSTDEEPQEDWVRASYGMTRSGSTQTHIKTLPQPETVSTYDLRNKQDEEIKHLCFSTSLKSGKHGNNVQVLDLTEFFCLEQLIDLISLTPHVHSIHIDSNDSHKLMLNGLHISQENFIKHIKTALKAASISIYKDTCISLLEIQNQTFNSFEALRRKIEYYPALHTVNLAHLYIGKKPLSLQQINVLKSQYPHLSLIYTQDQALYFYKTQHDSLDDLKAEHEAIQPRAQTVFFDNATIGNTLLRGSDLHKVEEKLELFRGNAWTCGNKI